MSQRTKIELLAQLSSTSRATLLKSDEFGLSDNGVLLVDESIRRTTEPLQSLGTTEKQDGKSGGLTRRRYQQMLTRLLQGAVWNALQMKRLTQKERAVNMLYILWLEQFTPVHTVSCYDSKRGSQPKVTLSESDGRVVHEFEIPAVKYEQFSEDTRQRLYRWPSPFLWDFLTQKSNKNLVAFTTAGGQSVSTLDLNVAFDNLKEDVLIKALPSSFAKSWGRPILAISEEGELTFRVPNLRLSTTGEELTGVEVVVGSDTPLPWMFALLHSAIRTIAGFPNRLFSVEGDGQAWCKVLEDHLRWMRITPEDRRSFFMREEDHSWYNSFSKMIKANLEAPLPITPLGVPGFEISESVVEPTDQESSAHLAQEVLDRNR